MPRKQVRYVDKAANQIRINGELITTRQNIREYAERIYAAEATQKHPSTIGWL